MPTVSTRPPNSEGAILSTCIEPLATASPCIANLSSSIGARGSANNALAATTAATAEAAEPPSPDASGTPLSSSSSKPKSSPSASCIAMRARPAVLCAASRGKSGTMPWIAVMVTPGSDTRLTVARSPIASTEKPRMSKPIATLPTEAGANARAEARGFALATLCVTTALPDRSRGEADRRTRLRP